MENIKKIYVDKQFCPITLGYNGSWHVIKHDTADNLDHSISIYDNFYYIYDDIESNYEGDEPMCEEQAEMYAWEEVMNMYEDMGVEIIIEG